MAFYMEEEEVWKCPKHPSKRRRNGICPVCLKDKLVNLCPDCANVRPCACCAATSSSSSASSSFSAAAAAGESDLRRSRSVGIPFLRSGSVRFNPAESNKPKTTSFWSILKPSKSKRGIETIDEKENEELKSNCYYVNGYGEERISEFTRMMIRSRSVSVSVTSGHGGGDVRKGGGKGWHFPSPMKVFRQAKTGKVVQERSPLYRG